MLFTSAIYAYLHFVAILTLASALGAEALLLRVPASPQTLKALARADLLYAISAAAVLASGLARLFLGGKPVQTYTSNPVFWTKMGLFAAVVLASLASTARILRWHRTSVSDIRFVPAADEWKKTRRMVFVELHLLALVPLPAVLMARGIGL